VVRNKPERKNNKYMKKLTKLVLSVLMATSMVACSSSSSSSSTGLYTAGTYTGEADGFGGTVKVTITVDSSSITDVTCEGPDETETVGGAALEELAEQIKTAQSSEIDGVSGATFTSDGIKEAAAKAIELAKNGSGAAASTESEGNVDVTYTAGTYTGTGTGYNGEIEVSVTFGENAIESIEVTNSSETNHVGTVAYDIMTADMIEANGTGVDAVSGATFTSRGFKEAVNAAAEQANPSDLDGFKKNTVVHEAQEAQEYTADVVVVGAGGAGMGAAAQAAQNGDSVIVLEENAEIGGNTLVSGGQFQSVMPYLVWDESDPDATTGVYPYDGKTYDKVKSANGYIDVLKTIANWSEEPFDESYFDDKEFVAGEITELSKAGVHAEYLSTLQALKKEINAYLDWAQPQLDAGAKETDLTLFSTVNLHIFQTYYGGLRQNADGTEWIYGDYDLVSQFVQDGQGLKEWLESQGALFDDGSQNTLIGALWHRENRQLGADMDGDGEVDEGTSGNWGAYFVCTENTVLTASDENQILTRTTANSLITEDGKVTGVKATMYDGTEVTVHANKGVVLATGGYAANIQMVVDTNEYWSSDYVSTNTKTTNRSSLVGDGITMGEEVGAATIGMGWAQMMPIAWIDNGNLAYGSGANCIYINPTTGNRFVNETSERDVLSLGEFANGVEVNGTKGVFLEIANADVAVGSGYPFDQYTELEDRVYFFSSADELQEILDKYGMEADPEAIYATIEDYDKSLAAGEQPKDCEKTGWTALIGTTADEDGNYDMDNYSTEGVKFRVRIMAPSAHHTMGGLSVDTERHVLDASGNIIEGLYAAGEVTGGIHGGNRLGGNAIVEIFVSGRTAANAIHADAE
jgi:urocanate reductase